MKIAVTSWLLDIFWVDPLIKPPQAGHEYLGHSAIHNHLQMDRETDGQSDYYRVPAFSCGALKMEFLTVD